MFLILFVTFLGKFELSKEYTEVMCKTRHEKCLLWCVTEFNVVSEEARKDSQDRFKDNQLDPCVTGNG